MAGKRIMTSFLVLLLVCSAALSGCGAKKSEGEQTEQGASAEAADSSESEDSGKSEEAKAGGTSSVRINEKGDIILPEVP